MSVVSSHDVEIIETSSSVNEFIFGRSKYGPMPASPSLTFLAPQFRNFSRCFTRCPVRWRRPQTQRHLCQKLFDTPKEFLPGFTAT